MEYRLESATAFTQYERESGRKNSSFFVISLLFVFICAALLGSLRLYGLYIEHRISETNSKIEACREENLNMSKRYSELLSPARVYSYARENLGMVNAENVVTVKLDGAAVQVANAGIISDEGVKTGGLEQVNPFVRKAHAKN